MNKKKLKLKKKKNYKLETNQKINLLKKWIWNNE